jgi:putative phosphoesterase
MRIAALYDIHGNLPALEAVLEEVRQLGVDRVLIGGDIVPGPMARETMDRLLELTIPVEFIVGNCEVALLQQAAGRESPAVPVAYHPIMHWTAEQLSLKYQQIISRWPKTLSMEIPDVGEVLFCHGTPRDENECFTRLTPEEQLLPIFGGLSASVVVCGHTHMQFDRTVSRTRIVNAGSVGMPFGAPGAYWLLLGPDVQLRRTQYDLAEAAERIRATSYPQAEDYVLHNVLQPPSEQQMLEVFSRAAAKTAG